MHGRALSPEPLFVSDYARALFVLAHALIHGLLGLAVIHGLGLVLARIHSLGLTPVHGLVLARIHGLGLTLIHGLHRLPWRSRLARIDTCARFLHLARHPRQTPAPDTQARTHLGRRAVPQRHLVHELVRRRQLPLALLAVVGLQPAHLLEHIVPVRLALDRVAHALRLPKAPLALLLQLLNPRHCLDKLLLCKRHLPVARQ